MTDLLPNEIPINEARKYLNSAKGVSDFELPSEIPVNEAGKYLPFIRVMPPKVPNVNTSSNGVSVKPTDLPISGRITQDYGVPVNYEKSGKHGGVDIAAAIGTPVPSKVDGEVVEVRDQGGTDFGKTVVIKGNDGIKRRYSHLNQFNVKAGQKIKPGDLIGTVGSTGRSTGSHLDYREYK